VPRPVPDDPSPDDLQRLLRTADAELLTHGADGAVLRVTALGAPSLAWFPLDGIHPLDLLLKFVAPPHWHGLGVSCAGWSHRLDDPSRARAESPPVTVTLLVHRNGAAAGVLRDGDRVTAMPDPPEGAVADACRRALGLATAPPPPSTVELWTLSWLDRLVATAAAGPGRLDGWAAIAALHPAARPAPAADDPVALAGATVALARAWPWSRLRLDPAVLDLPGATPAPELGDWMDDGMWARWMFGMLPPPDELVRALHDLLPTPLADAVEKLVAATCG
jgi:hypothetical protein